MPHYSIFFFFHCQIQCQQITDGPPRKITDNTIQLSMFFNNDLTDDICFVSYTDSYGQNLED